MSLLFIGLASAAYHAAPVAPRHAVATASRQISVNMALPAGEKCSFVLLAGGSGSRMKADRPKQFLNLLGRPVLEWDLQLLLGIEGGRWLSFRRLLRRAREGGPIADRDALAAYVMLLELRLRADRF